MAIQDLTPRAPRLLYVDWLRGVAVLIMILWHSMDAWTAPEARSGLGFGVVSALSGWAAPLFLFLAGVSLSLVGHRRAGVTGRQAAAWHLHKRGWQVFALAHLFRLQSFVLNPQAAWSSVLKPDILNILGLGLAAAALCWLPATTRRRQVLWLLVPMALIVLLTPLSRGWLWPTEWLRPLSPRFEAYIRPVPGLGVFTLFPWMAFVFGGAFVGARLADSHARGHGAPHAVGLAAAGLSMMSLGAVVLWGRWPAELPIWMASLPWFLFQLGLMTAALPAARGRLPPSPSARYARGSGGRGLSPILLFGQTSLFVYWVHVEMAYGIFSYPLHRALPFGWALTAFGALTALLYGAARPWASRRRPAIPAYLTVASTGRLLPDAQIR